MILGPKVGVLPSFVAKIVGNSYCTETSISTACHRRGAGKTPLINVCKMPLHFLIAGEISEGLILY